MERVWEGGREGGREGRREEKVSKKGWRVCVCVQTYTYGVYEPARIGNKGGEKRALTSLASLAHQH